MPTITISPNGVAPTILIDNAVHMAATVSSAGYTYNQLAVSNVWHVAHPLNKYPSVSVADSGGNLVIGEVRYVDTGNLVVSFSSPFSGTAYLN